MNDGPGELVVVQVGDLEPGVAHQPFDRAVERASAGDALLHAVETVLPARDAGVGAEAVLEEVERAARPQHPVHLAHGAGGVGNRAQRERAQRGVDRGVVERQVLTVEPDELDRAPVTRRRARPRACDRRVTGRPRTPS